MGSTWNRTVYKSNDKLDENWSFEFEAWIVYKFDLQITMALQNDWAKYELLLIENFE